MYDLKFTMTLILNITHSYILQKLYKAGSTTYIASNSQWCLYQTSEIPIYYKNYIKGEETDHREKKPL